MFCVQDPRVLDVMLPYMCEYYGNPHSRSHAYGWDSEKAVELARRVTMATRLIRLLDRQTDRQRERDRHTHTDRQTERQTDRQKDKCDRL